MSSIKIRNIEDVKNFPRKIITLIALIFIIIIIGTVGYVLISNISFSQALSRTFESFVFIFHDQSSSGKALGIFLALFGLVLIWWTLWSLFDILLEGNLREYLKISKFLSKLEKMRDHYIIAGGGRVGEEIAKELAIKRRDFIIIEKDLLTFNKLKKLGYMAIHGDVSEESILKKAGIERAKVIIVAMPETEKNLLVTMIARELNKDIDIYARCDKPAFVSKLKKAGAKVVVVPELVAAEKILESMR